MSDIIAYKLDGNIVDTQSINGRENAAEPIYFDNSPDALNVIRHSCAHLMAQAIKELYPQAKFFVGPNVEDGFYYDFKVDEANSKLSDEDLAAIEAKMKELAEAKLDIVKASSTKAFMSDKFKDDELKQEVLKRIPEGEVSSYKQGNFEDLCRGPHLPNTKFLRFFKLTRVAGAYLGGDETREMINRIYGTAFADKESLKEHIRIIEEAKKRDHRKIGKEMELFMFSERVGKGLPIWLPKGTELRLRLQDMLRKIQKRFGYQEVITPHIGSKNLYVTSGHYAHYGKDSFQPIHTPEEDEEYMLKPMNCPHHCEVFAWKPRSYKDLPLRIAEFGTVYRYEKSGELHGLTRVRSFTQDDAHIFCRPEQVKNEFLRVMDIIQAVFKIFQFDNFEAQISLRDPNNTTKYIGSDEVWEESEQAIIDACKEKGLDAKIAYGEAAFYGPKLDFMVKDAIGRRWQLGTIQVDYNLPERFKLEYTAEDNTKKTPVMVHRAPFGSMERFSAVLIEHTAGHFPLWLIPDQVAILPISEKFNDYAQRVAKYLDSVGVRATLDIRNEKIGRKIRDNEIKRVPYMVIVGEKEAEEGLVSMRKQGGGEQATMTMEEFAKRINDEVAAQLAATDIHPND